VKTGDPGSILGRPRPGPPAETPYGSHEVRLSCRQWLVAGPLVVAGLALLPTLWTRFERFEPGADYRIPYALSSDYWLFRRYCRWAAGRRMTLLIGDSVVWGQYVGKEQTLTHWLNRQAGAECFANMGVDGMHPAALAGLLQHYGQAVSGRNVVLHCNLLWLSSPRHDLQTEKEFAFNHPRLVPQFVARIPCYRASYSRRLDVIIEREVPFLSWADHLRQAYFAQRDVAAWTLQHPYANPLAALTRGLPPPDDGPRQPPIPWTERGLIPQDFPWVELETSLQWRSLERALAFLEAKDSEVFVIVGPFNEHMLTEADGAVFAALRDGIAARLGQRGVACWAAPLLPSREYADASHPLSEGYARLAQELFDDEGFVRFDAHAGAQHAGGTQ